MFFGFVLASKGSIVIKVFNHWFYRATLARVAIDLMFPVLCVILVAVWVGRGGQLALEKVAFYGLIFALMTIAFNAWKGPAYPQIQIECPIYRFEMSGTQIQYTL